LVSAVFGRLFKQGGDGANIEQLGDRVISNLLALPFIVCWIILISLQAPIEWVLAAPVPLAIYVVLLAGNDLGWSWTKGKGFTKSLLFGVIAFYPILAIYALMVDR